MALGHPPLCPLRKAGVRAHSGLPDRLLCPLPKDPAPLRTVPRPQAALPSATDTSRALPVVLPLCESPWMVLESDKGIPCTQTAPALGRCHSPHHNSCDSAWHGETALLLCQGLWGKALGGTTA